MELPRLDPASLRDRIVGADLPVVTPFGERLLVYADYTASGRCLDFVEAYLGEVAALYANSHTEDSLTGRAATHLLHDAEAAIKRAVNAGPDGKVICTGAGSTAAIHKLQEILGVAVPPATCRFLTETTRAALGDPAWDVAAAAVAAGRPVVFVGPYEHHSNEVTWREGLCDVVEVELCPSGRLDLDDLEAKLTDPRWDGRRKLGSFSAASNVTGVRAPVHDIARLLHRHGAPALFDFAAAGPYVDIDMNPAGDPEARLDAVFLSPHKFVGGPGAAGLLVFDGALYPSDLPPTVGGGGTVDYVGPHGHDFTADVEARETAGTPGLFQVLRAALALEVKRAVGAEAIHARERAHLGRALGRWAEAGIEVLGPDDPDGRLGIVSFNTPPGADGHRLHPRFVTVLLDDLFGIQSRAGCSCAGPYGHRLLGIDEARSERYRGQVRAGLHGMKPGWCRVGFHFTMDDAEADYVIEAVAFVAEHGRRFLPLYRFDVHTGAWAHRDGVAPSPSFSLPAALAASPVGATACPEAERRDRYRRALEEARALAASLDEPVCDGMVDEAVADLQFFAVVDGTFA